ncbi:MAG: tetratricopeptide repeat protein, partial [Aphanizomenon sp.]
AAFDLSWEELKPEAQYLACVLAAFAPSPIRWDFVTRIYQQLQGELFNHDNLKDRWLKSLRKLHLVITVDKDIYNLHLLIHDYFYEQLKQHLNFSQIKQAFCDVFVVVASNIDKSTNLKTFNLIEPHLKKMIAWCENKEDIEFALSLNNLARLYYFQGRYNDAEPLFLQSLDILKLQLGNDHPDVAQSLNNLAQLYFSQENYLEAENLAQQALVIYQQKLGSEHPDTQNAAVGVKLLYIMKLLQCNKNTLFSILEALAQQASLPDLNTETALTLLEQIENNPDLLSSIREYLQRQTEASDDDT